MSSTRRSLPGIDRDQLIERHLPLVRALARRYSHRGADFEDLFQVGAVGLIKAADRFDPGHGAAFPAFATPVIEGEIRHHLRDTATAVRIPRQLQALAGKVRRCQRELTATLGRAPTLDELAIAAGSDPVQVERALSVGQAREALPLDSEEGGATEPQAGSDDRLELAGLMRGLNDRERRIVYLRFHADKTERQIARELGISQAHVSRLLSGALAKLRDGLAEPGAKPAGDIAPEALISRRAARAESPAPDLGAPRTPDKPAPERAPGSGHSGRFLVRMPSALHRDLARAAEREHVSLNRFVTDTLAASVSGAPAGDADPAAKPAGPDHPAAEPTGEPAGDAGELPRPRTIRLVLAANVVVVLVTALVAVTLIVLALERGL